MCVCVRVGVCACVCLSVRERVEKREEEIGETKRDSQCLCIKLLAVSASISGLLKFEFGTVVQKVFD